MATKGKSGNTGKAALAAAAAAAVAAGYYFYASKDAAKNRKVAARWATDMKREVVVQAKRAKKMDRATMMKMVDGAAKAYRAARSIDRKEVEKAVRELKANWQHLAKESGSVAAKAKTVVKKVVQKKRR